MTAPEAIDHTQQPLQVPHHAVSTLICEVPHKIILSLRAAKNAPPAMELTTEVDRPNNSTEEIVNVMKTKSGLPKIHKCTKCIRTFSRRSSLTKHLKILTSGMKCTLCSKTFYSQVKLANHIKIHHTPSKKVKDVLCPECGKGFDGHTELMLHLRTHTAERYFKCAFCEKRFLYIFHRKCHERLHTSEHTSPSSTFGQKGTPAKNPLITPIKIR